MHRKNITLLLLLSFLLYPVYCLATPDGTYLVQMKGTNYLFQGATSTTTIKTNTTLTVLTMDENITIKVEQIDSIHTPTTYKGKWNKQTGDFSAIWWFKGAANKSKLLFGKVKKNQISGSLVYPKVAHNLIPGYVNLEFSGSKDAGQRDLGSGNSHSSLTTPLPAFNNDCITFDPDHLKVHNIDGQWNITTGEDELINFGNRRLEAAEALIIIKYYEMDQVCYVGQPDPALTYWLVRAGSPSGSLSKEDCIGFSSHKLVLRKIKKRWKIYEGENLLLDIGPDNLEARLVLHSLKRYRFQYHCFVGRPRPSFDYWRR